MQTVAENKKAPWARVAPGLELKETRQPAEEVAERGYACFQPEVVAKVTYKLFSTRGWCLWKCDILNGDVIVVVRDELVEGVPAGYPVYYEQELSELLDADDAMIRMVHEAKKKAEVNIVSG